MKTKYKHGSFIICPEGERKGLIHPSGLFGICGKVVTHIPTGLSFGNAGFPSQRQARLFVENVIPLTDWSKITLENQLSIYGLGEQVKKLRSECGYL